MAEKALLVVSFGTSYAQTRERTIGAIERKLAERFPDRIVHRAWTSSFLIKKVAKTTARTNQIYNDLVAAAEALLTLVKGRKGRTNKDNAKLTSQIRSLIAKWKD